MFPWWGGGVFYMFSFQSTLGRVCEISWNPENQNHLSKDSKAYPLPLWNVWNPQLLSSGGGVGWQDWRWGGLNGWVTQIHTQTFGPVAPEVTGKWIRTFKITGCCGFRRDWTLFTVEVLFPFFYILSHINDPMLWSRVEFSNYWIDWHEKLWSSEVTPTFLQCVWINFNREDSATIWIWSQIWSTAVNLVTLTKTLLSMSDRVIIC